MGSWPKPGQCDRDWVAGQGASCVAGLVRGWSPEESLRSCLRSCYSRRSARIPWCCQAVPVSDLAPSSCAGVGIFATLSGFCREQDTLSASAARESADDDGRSRLPCDRPEGASHEDTLEIGVTVSGARRDERFKAGDTWQVAGRPRLGHVRWSGATAWCCVSVMHRALEQRDDWWSRRADD